MLEVVVVLVVVVVVVMVMVVVEMVVVWWRLESRPEDGVWGSSSHSSVTLL